MFKQLSLIFILGLGAVSTGLAQPDVDQILKQVRLVAVAQEGKLDGKLRSGRERMPVTMFLKGDNIQYHLGQGGEKVVYQLTLGANNQKLQLFDGQAWKPLPKNRYGVEIGKTNLTYEDLSLRFLYWPNGKIDEEDNIQGIACNRILLRNPDGNGKYASVLLWVGKENAALMRIEGFDKKNQPLKRFSVAKVMKFQGGYFVESMRVEPLLPNGRVDGVPSYIEFEKPEVKRRRPQ